MKSQWIDASKALPAVPGRYLIVIYKYRADCRELYGYERIISIAHKNPDRDYFLGHHQEGERALYWMPLPEIPE